MNPRFSPPVGPVLFLDDLEDGQMSMSALFITARGETLPPVELPQGNVSPIELAEYDHATVWRARFTLSADRASDYRWNGTTYAIAGNLAGDLRLAYVSCNGEEVADMDREGSERNPMWERLRSQHRRRPFALMLHGGDQVYADEVTERHELSDN